MNCSPCKRPRRLGCLLLAACGLVSASAGAGAVLEGHVTLPPERAAVVVTKRYEIVARAGSLSHSPPLAVVYLEGDFAPPAAPPVTQMSQKDLVFLPALLPVQVGTRVEFPNFDETYHNIFSFSAPKRFDLGRYLGDERPIPTQVFDTPGLVTVRCDIHEHMRALILVLATPHFVLTDEAGHYRLEGVPAGHWVLKAWIDSRTVRSVPVDVPVAGVLRVDFP